MARRIDPCTARPEPYGPLSSGGTAVPALQDQGHEGARGVRRVPLLLCKRRPNWVLADFAACEGDLHSLLFGARGADADPQRTYQVVDVVQPPESPGSAMTEKIGPPFMTFAPHMLAELRESSQAGVPHGIVVR